MEPDVSIETSSMIRPAVRPVGSFPINLLRDYWSMLLRYQWMLLRYCGEVTISPSLCQSCLTFHKPGAEVIIPVTLKAWQLGLADSDIRHSKDGSRAALLCRYIMQLIIAHPFIEGIRLSK